MKNVLLFLIVCASAYSLDSKALTAVKNNKPDLLIKLLDGGDYTYISDDIGRTLLHWAAYYNRTDILPLLLENGFNINEQDNEGNTPLNLAAENESIEACEYLLEMNADLQIQNKWGTTCLHKAFKFRNENLIYLFLNCPDIISIQDINGETPLHIAVKQHSSSILYDRDYLISGDIDIQDKTGSTVLHRLTEKKIFTDDDANLLQMLILNKADINKQNALGQTPLHSAVKANNPEAVEILLNNFADTEILDNFGRTATDLAIILTYSPITTLFSSFAEYYKTPTGRANRAIHKYCIENFRSSGQPMNFSFWYDHFVFENIDTNKEDEEAVITIKCHEGEGCYSIHLIIVKGDELIIAEQVTSGYYGHDSYTEIVDVDNDGISEILIVGETRGSNDNTDIQLFKYNGSSLDDIIYDKDFGSSYYLLDIDNDSYPEIIGIGYDQDRSRFSPDKPSILFSIRKRDESGLFKKLESNFDETRIINNLLDDLFSDTNNERLNRHNSLDLSLLSKYINEKGIIINKQNTLHISIPQQYSKSKGEGFISMTAYVDQKKIIPFLKKLMFSESDEDYNSPYYCYSYGRIIALNKYKNLSTPEIDTDFLLEVLINELQQKNFYNNYNAEIIAVMLTGNDFRGLQYCLNQLKAGNDSMKCILREFKYLIWDQLLKIEASESDPKILYAVKEIKDHKYYNSQYTPYRFWLNQLNSENQDFRMAAFQAVAEINGVNYLPTLLPRLKKEKDSKTFKSMLRSTLFITEHKECKLSYTEAIYLLQQSVNYGIRSESRKNIYKQLGTKISDTLLVQCFYLEAGKDAYSFSYDDSIFFLLDMIIKRDLYLDSSILQLFEGNYFFMPLTEYIIFFQNICKVLTWEIKQELIAKLHNNINNFSKENPLKYIDNSLILLGILQVNSLEELIKKKYYQYINDDDYELDNFKDGVMYYCGLLNTKTSADFLCLQSDSLEQENISYSFALVLLNTKESRLIFQKIGKGLIDELKYNKNESIYYLLEYLEAAGLLSKEIFLGYIEELMSGEYSNYLKANVLRVLPKIGSIGSSKKYLLAQKYKSSSSREIRKAAAEIIALSK